MTAGWMPETRQERPWIYSGLTLPNGCGPGRSATEWGMCGITIQSCWSPHTEPARKGAPQRTPSDGLLCIPKSLSCTLSVVMQNAPTGLDWPDDADDTGGV